MTLLQWLAQWEYAHVILEQWDESVDRVKITIFVEFTGYSGRMRSSESMVCPAEEVGTWIRVMVGRLGIAALLEGC